MTYKTSGALEIDTITTFLIRAIPMRLIRVVSLPKLLGSQLYLRQMGLLGSLTFEKGLCPL